MSYWQQPGRRSPSLLLLAVLIAFLAGLAAASHGGGRIPAPAQAADDPALPAAASLPAALLGPDTIANIVESAGPAVVRIDTVSRSEAAANPFSDPFFRQFFGDQFRQTPRQQQGLGSGFIISQDGYVLTNSHVVEGASEVKVTVAGYQQPLAARVVGSDHDLDLAVLKIEAEQPLPFLKLGDADKARVGEWVIAIGNPGGLDHTVTVGVISAKGRPIAVEDRNYENLLQTDASINPGNSGGPLLNLRGEVIGINTAVNAAAQGIGFAIPASTVQPVLKDLIEKGEITRPYLGVGTRDVTQDVADALGLDEARGALLQNVAQGSPAAKAGLKRGDVILAVDGQAIKTGNDLVKLVQGKQVGDRVTIQYVRQGQRAEVTATLAARPKQVK